MLQDLNDLKAKTMSTLDERLIRLDNNWGDLPLLALSNRVYKLIVGFIILDHSKILPR